MLAAHCHWWWDCFSRGDEAINTQNLTFCMSKQRPWIFYCTLVYMYISKLCTCILTHTKKSRFCLMFMKSPPTIAARWITWVGWCFWNNFRVSSKLLGVGFDNTDCSGSLLTGCVSSVLFAYNECVAITLQEIGIFGGKEYPVLPFLGSSQVFDHAL